ncbi:uncharacterized protein LOC123267314 [Cotesia glomerata]|uniref:uncharacterized protein LOC123267314 n=1 Tax=Cotesia glomerata TaxID=32391 RepID=UPI001D02430C|nr:uncharacterized protein LOC123267314 [Cotesia glomerata]
MTFSVNRVIKESEKTSFTVHLLLDRCTMDDKLENQLIEFSLGLLHRKVEFTACGIISLDGSLLQSVSAKILMVIDYFRTYNKLFFHLTGFGYYRYLSCYTYTILVEFSIELLHQKMEFSAFGIISFDGSLLETMTGTIVTYLVILVQFQIELSIKSFFRIIHILQNR